MHEIKKHYRDRLVESTENLKTARTALNSMKFTDAVRVSRDLLVKAEDILKTLKAAKAQDEVQLNEANAGILMAWNTVVEHRRFVADEENERAAREEDSKPKYFLFREGNKRRPFRTVKWPSRAEIKGGVVVVQAMTEVDAVKVLRGASAHDKTYEGVEFLRAP